jgi:hypothetical protein
MWTAIEKGSHDAFMAVEDPSFSQEEDLLRFGGDLS